MTPLVIKYPLDLTGINPTNLVIGEPHTMPRRKVRAIATNYGPFFTEGLKVFDQVTGLRLRAGTPEEGGQYVAAEMYAEATTRTGKEVCAIIVITDESVSDTVLIDYQVLGGEFSSTAAIIAQQVEALDLDERPVRWGDILGLPSAFPPAHHLHDIGDIFGFEYLVSAIERLRHAILMGDVASHDEIYRYIDNYFQLLDGKIAVVQDDLADHKTDYSNPHGVTKTQVGLSNVQNYAIASKAEAEAGSVNNRYMTPLRTKEAIDILAIVPLNAHISRMDNPHGTTKAQVGLGNVENFPMATEAEARAGVAASNYMSALRVGQAITTLALTPLNAHIARTDNPHGVTKAQIGLSNVDNYVTATTTVAIAGTSTTSFVTPAGLKGYADTNVMPTINNHIARQDNPHNVTKAQIGLGNVLNYGMSTEAEARAGTINTAFMSPLRTAQAIATQALTPLNAHVARTDNPHSTTKAQVGLGSVDNFATASVAVATAGTSTTTFVTPAGIKGYADANVIPVINAHTARVDNPHNTTKAQVGLGSVLNYGVSTEAEARAGSVNTSYMTPLRVSQAITTLALTPLNAHTSRMDNPHNTTKAQVGLGSVDNFATASVAVASAGTSTTTFVTPAGVKGYSDTNVMPTINNHIANRSNPHAVTAAQVGAYTTAQTDTLLNGKLGKTETAANSNQLGGSTKAQVLAEAYAAVGSMGKRALFISTADPTTQGVVGDVWFKY